MGTAYSDVEMKLKIDVGASSTYSESLGMATLDKMYDKGDLSVDDYVELAPDNVMPFKETLKKLRSAELEQAQQLQSQMMQGGQLSEPMGQNLQTDYNMQKTGGIEY